MPGPHRFLTAVAAMIAAVLVLTTATPAQAQTICANFFPTSSGRYADLLDVTITGPTTTATAHAITGLQLAATAGSSQCTAFALSQDVARIDLEVLGVDPGEQVWFVLDSVEHAVVAGELLRNPGVTTVPLALSAGRLISAGADGSAYLELGQPGLDQFSLCASATGSTGGVIIYPTINSLCICGNGNRHFNEDCDDGDQLSGDGCSAVCAEEDGWTCTGGPQAISVCEPLPAPDAGIPDAEVPDAEVPDADAPGDAGPEPDSGTPDSDAGPSAGDRDDGSCGCQGGGDGASGTALIAALGLAALTRRRRLTGPGRTRTPR